MDRNEIRTKVRDLLRDIVDEPNLAITDQTCAANVAWWDSLAHMKLLVAIEEEWGLAFQVSEINAPEDVGQLIDLVNRKLAAQG